jgi:signal peptide peptidase SppA
MNSSLLLGEFLSTPWAMMPDRLQAIASVLARWSTGQSPDDAVAFQIQTDRVLRTTRKQYAADRSNAGIAVLPLYGVITQRGNMIDNVSGPGCTSTEQFSAALRKLMADDSVAQILIDIDSPGGSVYGVAELAAEIFQARSQKPIVAIANSLAASAAYWIGSSASEFYVTPGGEVGSIGVWQAHQDLSNALDKAGIKTTLISAGTYKVEGNPYAPLDPEAQAFMQSRVDDYYQAFTKAVAKGRNVALADVLSGMGQGRVLGAQSAKQKFMVDDIASFDQVLINMQRQTRSSMTNRTIRSSRIQQTRDAISLM